MHDGSIHEKNLGVHPKKIGSCLVNWARLLKMAGNIYATGYYRPSFYDHRTIDDIDGDCYGDLLFQADLGGIQDVIHMERFDSCSRSSIRLSLSSHNDETYVRVIIDYGPRGDDMSLFFQYASAAFTTFSLTAHVITTSFSASSDEVNFHIHTGADWDEIIGKIYAFKDTQICPMPSCQKLFVPSCMPENVCLSCAPYITEKEARPVECVICYESGYAAGMVHCNVCKSGSVCMICLGKMYTLNHKTNSKPPAKPCYPCKPRGCPLCRKGKITYEEDAINDARLARPLKIASSYPSDKYAQWTRLYNYTPN